ncbi:MoaD/ThiS family protein [Ningiella sp. W23]|uniref:MoaD/ThiS family protein n=1 Tax=Ningiella sp. W23 TaxID=3023715 RepID=UPI003757EBF2
MIEVKLFASLREAVGSAAISVDASHVKNVSDVIKILIEGDRKWSLLNEQNVLLAVNHELSARDRKINDGDEIAFFPPVTGG